jgi:hypothetical protein
VTISFEDGLKVGRSEDQDFAFFAESPTRGKITFAVKTEKDFTAWSDAILSRSVSVQELDREPVRGVKRRREEMSGDEDDKPGDMTRMKSQASIKAKGDEEWKDKFLTLTSRNLEIRGVEVKCLSLPLFDSFY